MRTQAMKRLTFKPHGGGALAIGAAAGAVVMWMLAAGGVVGRTPAAAPRVHPDHVQEWHRLRGPIRTGRRDRHLQRRVERRAPTRCS